ncbi:MAG: hypothetical protein VW547_05535 [Alphaproteobacteria bacterium]
MNAPHLGTAMALASQSAQRSAGVEGAPWVTTDMLEARRARAMPYKDLRGGLEEIVEKGIAKVMPTGVRILMRAILSQDTTTLAQVSYDAREAICFEVVAVSPACEVFWDQHGVPDEKRDARGLWQRARAFFSGRGAVELARPRPGDHVWLASADADRLSGSDPACRLWSVHPEDLPALWRI